MPNDLISPDHPSCIHPVAAFWQGYHPRSKGPFFLHRRERPLRSTVFSNGIVSFSSMKIHWTIEISLFVPAWVCAQTPLTFKTTSMAASFLLTLSVAPPSPPDIRHTTFFAALTRELLQTCLFGTPGELLSFVFTSTSFVSSDSRTR